MVAVGLYLVVSASKVLHLAIGAIGASAAYALYMGIVSGWPIFSAIFFALAIAVVFGLFSAELLEPFAVRREPLLGLLASLALGIIIEAMISIFFGTDGKSLERGILTVVPVFGDIKIDLPGLITIFLGILSAAVLWTGVHFTAMGRILRGVAENSPLSVSLGINNKVVRRCAYVLAAIVAGAVISLTGWHTALTPLMGFPLIIAAFIALLTGGIGDLRGTIIASYAITIIPGLIIGYSYGFSQSWHLVFVFLIAAAVLSIRPYGIFSARTREA